MTFPRAKVVISEIMFHPVKEDSDEDLHEFVELHNRSAESVDLGGHSIESSGAGGIKYTFPANTKLDPGADLVVAKSRKALAQVTSYGITQEKLFGDYSGQLDNGGTTVALRDGAGVVVDAVKYADAAPWPASADALGVGEEWLSAGDKPLAKHKLRGRSLERIDNDGPSGDPGNWEASTLDGATPGKPNSVKGNAKPVALEVTAEPEGRPSERIIGKEDSVVIRARFSDLGKIEEVKVLFFEDDVTRTDEKPATAPMVFSPTDKSWQVTLPSRPENTLTRYQIVARRNGGSEERVSPRVSDPRAWHAFFVTPKIASTSRTYHLFIAPADWSNLETWVSEGRNKDKCTAAPNFDTAVPATFVHDGHVYDVRVRYSGGGFNRGKGLLMPASWNFPKPALPAGRAFQAVSWKVKFPKYDSFGGASSINLNKMLQTCPGTSSIVESKLLAQVGLPTYNVRFARLHVNGGYFLYAAEVEPIGDEVLKRSLKDGERAGDLFKADGFLDEAGSTRGDFKPISAPADYCNGKFTALDRYKIVYTRENYDYRGHDELIKLIVDLDAAIKAGGIVSKAVQDYFETYWDVEALARSFAVRNWSGAWDDSIHNYFPYKQPNGKWIVIQQDFDMDFGLGKYDEQHGFSPWRWDETLYLGAYEGQAIGATCEITMSDAEKAAGHGCNGLGFSRLKDVFIRNFRAKFDGTMKELTRSTLSTDAVLKLMDEAIAQFNMDDWRQSPGDKAFCKPGPMHDDMRAWARKRNELVKAKLGD